MSINELSTKEKVSLLKELYLDIANKGQYGDTMLAHINPYEAQLLKAYGGSGTINPTTGLPQYTPVVTAIASFAATAAPYVSAFTSAYSFVKQRSEGKKASRREADRVSLVNQKNEQQRRIQNARISKQRIIKQQEARTQTADMLTKGMRAGVVQTGSSGLTNAMGGLFTDSNNYQNYLTGVTESGETLSQTQRGIDTATSGVNTSLMNQKGWSQIGQLSGSIGDSFGGFKNPFEAFDTPTTKLPTSSANYSE